MRMATRSDVGGEPQGGYLLPALLLACLAAGTVMRLYGIGTWDLRGDEIFTYVSASTDPGQRGIFSPYYHVASVLLSVFDNELLAVRLPAAIAGVLSLVAFYFFAREALGAVAATMATLLLCFSPQHVELSQFARYYSTVFLFGTLHFWLVLIFLRTGSLRHLLVGVCCGAVAALSHLPAAVVFIVAGLYVLLALRFTQLLPVPRAYVAGAAVLGFAFAILAFPADIASAWLGFERWDNSAWAMIPLLAFNHYTLPVFAAAIFGVAWMIARSETHVWLLALLAVSTACLLLFIFNLFMNFAPRYLTALSPWFYLAAGALCGAPARSGGPRQIWGAVAATLILISAQLPVLASFFLEQKHISPEAALRYVVAEANPDDVLEGNVRSPFLDPAMLERAAWRGDTTDSSVAWSEHLDRYLSSPVTVWFVNEVPRSGYAPDYEAWLLEHAERVLVQRAGRIDRQQVTLEIWKRAPQHEMGDSQAAPSDGNASSEGSTQATHSRVQQPDVNQTSRGARSHRLP